MLIRTDRALARPALSRTSEAVGVVPAAPVGSRAPGTGVATWPARAVVAQLAGAGTVGGLAGAAAAVADERLPLLGALLSVPGPWIAAAVLVAWWAQRPGAGVEGAPWAPAPRRVAWAGAATALFLAAAVVAYYAGKQALTGAMPAPLVLLWLGVAVALGGLGGAAAALLCARPRGTVFLGGAVSGWLLAEAVAMPAATVTESGMGLAAAALTLSIGLRPAPSARAWLLGCLLGAAAQAAFLMAIRGAFALVL